ncbi:MAG TPA: trypsin-like peptidase domain-containing protein [Pseudogracilibacillus sp.]|nr:trypsin-like peptidase domain-containing protein [Pseudogracilibacillus sp.]
MNNDQDKELPSEESKEILSREQLIYAYESEINSLKKNQKNKRGFLFHLTTGVVGGIVAAFIIVVLIANNLIPMFDFNSSTSQSPLSESTETMSNDLTSDSEIKDVPIAEVSKAVVGVKNIRTLDPWTNTTQGGTGSGIIYKQENNKAYIVTNNHVIEDAEEIEIELSNKEVVPAKLLGSDPLTDLAVLEMDDEHVEYVAEFYDSDKLEVGETVIAIGNPLGSEFAGSVTKGIISGLNRSVEVDTNGDKQPDWVTEVLQTDAAINPGNSGGALVNTKGKVIGINSMKVAQSAVEGIGLAIPSNTAQPIIKDLEEKGEVNRPTLGIATAPLNQVPPEVQQQIDLPKDVRSGMVIANVDSDSPAEKAGLKKFDVITKIDQQEITSIVDIKVALYTDALPNDKVTIEYVRNGKKQTSELTLIN